MKKHRASDRGAAIALTYDPDGLSAPTIVASGYGEIAKRIMELAKENKIHIHRDDNLVELLARVPVGTAIPEEAYQLVAELLAFLYRTDRRLGEKKRVKQ
ncbi:flagellar biosynthesis protein [Mariprofundus micogutta]|uniref:Flagellar biosynthesis protein n=1 Tax=Mariprofundus micogutta TaxID=1921010 RepID=A0A1L8CQ48_9PROT|nr:EscU/YscU/HrcU family type III secretion system export apparatus switch protein [Mariprofundus micogutta]GAV20949.1 flagellar biosynthesis protein [Mariprofundus micogutta]